MKKFASRALNKTASLLYQQPGSQPDPQTARIQPWLEACGDKTRRLDYPLDSKSVVFDLGGYEGQWASDITARFGCQVHVFEPLPAYAEAIKARFAGNPRIKVYPFGL